MGAYLDKPRTEKATSRKSIGNIDVAVSEMQGWRLEMEDASLIDLDHASDLLLFGVFDGHGGKEVAKYTAAHLGRQLLRSYTTAPASDSTARLTDLERSLYKSFLDVDASILLPSVVDELSRIAGVSELEAGGDNDKDSSSERAEEIDLLQQEATMPIEELRKLYGGAPSAQKDDQSSASTATFKHKWGGLLHMLAGGKRPGDEDQEGTGAGAAKDGDSDCSSGDSISSEDSNDVSDADAGDMEDKQNDVDSRGPDTQGKAKRKRTTPDNDSSSDNTDDDDEDQDVANDTPHRKQRRQEPASTMPEEEEERVGVSSGTTATVALLLYQKDETASAPLPSHIVVANAGDSRCVLCRGGKAKDLSQDHKPEDKVERTRIHAAGGVIRDGRVNGGLNLSRAIGDHMYKRNSALPLHAQMISAAPDVVVEPIQEDDLFFVLACDGIWNSMESAEVVTFIKERLEKGKEIGAICEELCDACMSPSMGGDGTGCDNETAMIVLLNKSKICTAEWLQQTSF